MVVRGLGLRVADDPGDGPVVFGEEGVDCLWVTLLSLVWGCCGGGGEDVFVVQEGLGGGGMF